METRLSNTAEALLARLRQKVKVDNHFPAERHLTVQAFVIEKIIETTKALPDCLDQVMRVVTNPRFQIVVTTAEYINEVSGINASSVFIPEDNCILFAPSKLNPSVINHEFRHADLHYRHIDHVRDDESAAFPILKTETSMRDYESALDRGDDRVKRYKLLWEKKLKNNLSRQEEDEFAQYEAAAQGCLAPVIVDTNSLNILPFLGVMGVRKGAVIKKGLERKEILDIQVMSDRILIALTPADIAMRVFFLLELVSENLNNEHYRDAPAYIKLVERDAYTFQNFSARAIEVFYPEANRLMQEDMKLCEQLKRLGESLIVKKNLFQKSDAVPDKLKLDDQTTCPAPLSPNR
jgi:hypothetical protein